MTEKLVTMSAADLVLKVRSEITIKGGWLTIRTEWHRQCRDRYDIALRRLDSPIKLLGWLSHLSQKVWFDRRLCRELTDKVSHHFGWRIHPV
jgi:hypothetical protein